MELLSIGNSFSEDAQRYLHEISLLSGEPISCTDLVIGGCSLERHAKNAENDLKEEMLEVNGEFTGFFVTVDEALRAKKWDAVTLQQASHFSPFPETYDPFLKILLIHVRKYAPSAKIYLHETWAYEENYARTTEELHLSGQKEMEEKLLAAYENAAKREGLLLVPSGKTFAFLREKTRTRLYRDGFHAAFGIGRYALACCMFNALTGKPVSEKLPTLDEPVSPSDAQAAREAAQKAVEFYKNF